MLTLTGRGLVSVLGLRICRSAWPVDGSSVLASFLMRASRLKLLKLTPATSVSSKALAPPPFSVSRPPARSKLDDGAPRPPAPEKADPWYCCWFWPWNLCRRLAVDSGVNLSFPSPTRIGRPARSNPFIFSRASRAWPASRNLVQPLVADGQTGVLGKGGEEKGGADWLSDKV